MKVLAVCRGMPGLGRVVPALGVVQTLRRTTGRLRAVFATYAVGAAYLAAVGEDVVDVGRPTGLFIEPAAPQTLRVLELIDVHEPDLVLVDGEFYLPQALAHLSAPVVYLANPHDVIGPSNPFRRANRHLLGHADVVVVASLTCAVARRRPDLVPGAICIEVPAIVKEFSVAARNADGPPRVLVSSGGGSVGAHTSFRRTTDAALHRIVDELGELAHSGEIGPVTIVLGADATLSVGPYEWLQVIDRPLELTKLYAEHDVLVARAGRNATAEALYSGMAAVLLPITDDPYRGFEQARNARAATAARPRHVVGIAEWRRPMAIADAVRSVVAYLPRVQRRPGARGNEAAAACIRLLLDRTEKPRGVSTT